MLIYASWALQLKYLEHENRRNIKGTALGEQGRPLKGRYVIICRMLVTSDITER